jgi:spore coat polysaccharide biosynthesis protein SpsF (cytidylyltransferase family)
MTTVAVVNVRMESTRLPGKALRDVCGKPLLERLLDRLRLAQSLDRIVVATSVRPANDSIESFCKSRQIECFRGSEDDVLSRLLGALTAAGATTGVVVFGDGPLVDPAIIDQVVGEYRRAAPPYHFVGNDLRTTYPPGMEVEVFSVAALADADDKCTDPAIREHGTLYLRLNPGKYRLLNIEAPPQLCRPDLELEVDTAADLQVLEWVTAQFGSRTDFSLGEIIRLLDGQPQLTAINRDIPRRWKEFRSDGD